MNTIVWISFSIFSLLGLTFCKQRENSSCPVTQGLSFSELTGKNAPSKLLSLSLEDVSGESWQDISHFFTAQKIKGTFFISGAQATEYQSRASFLQSQGHLIASRGWAGQDLSSIPDPVAEVRRADFAFSMLFSNGISLLRSSGGWNGDVASELNASGLGFYIGSIGMEVGWKKTSFRDDLDCWNSGVNVVTCNQGYLEAIRQVDHGIVNFRTTQPQTLSLLKALLPQLLLEGYTFVRIDEVPDIASRLSMVKGAPGSGKSCSDY